VLKLSSQNASVTSGNGVNLAMPALMNMASSLMSRLVRVAARDFAAATSAASLRSATTLPRRVVLAFSRVCGSRPVMTTRAPSAANACAVASPMPVVPPVTKTVFPSKRFMTISIDGMNEVP
jgi:hypothetical protein